MRRCDLVVDGYSLGAIGGERQRLLEERDRILELAAADREPCCATEPTDGSAPQLVVSLCLIGPCQVCDLGANGLRVVESEGAGVLGSAGFGLRLAEEA